MKNKLILLIFILFLIQCDFSYTYWTDGDYLVSNMGGSPSGVHLVVDCKDGTYHGRVNNINEIGSDKDFIIAKSENKYNSDYIEYWILDKLKDHFLLNSDEIMIGPFSFEEFETEKKKLGIESLKFEKSF